MLTGRPEPNMNMSKLAKLAGVSVSTISKAFSGSSEISDEKREYIFQIAREQGCYDKYCKNEYHKPVIAVICPEFQSRYYSEHLFFMEKEVKERGGILLAACTDFEQARMEELLTYFTEYAKADGIILYGERPARRYHVPIVSVGNYSPSDTIYLSNEHSVSEAIRYLAENGHTDIAFIGERLTTSKKELFIEALQKNRLPVCNEYIVVSEQRFETAGYEAMNRLFALSKPPTAILAAYDNIAIGAMKCIYEHGAKIPEDISIIGMGDNKEAAYLNAPLTSISTYNEDWCQIIVDLLFEQMKGGQRNAVKRIKLSSELVKRDSVGKVRKPSGSILCRN